MDLPGFGATPPPESAIGARDYARLLLPVLDEFEQPPLLVGHSFGGRVAVCLAAEYPDRIRGTLVTGAPLLRLTPGKNPPATYKLARVLNRFGVVSDTSFEAMKRKRGSADYRAVTGVMRDILVTVVNEEYRDELTRIAGPIHFLWGADDREVPFAVAEEAAALVSRSGGDATLEVVEAVGHMLPVQDPDSLRNAVTKMLA